MSDEAEPKGRIVFILIASEDFLVFFKLSFFPNVTSQILLSLTCVFFQLFGYFKNYIFIHFCNIFKSRILNFRCVFDFSNQ